MDATPNAFIALLLGGEVVGLAIALVLLRSLPRTDV